MNIKVEMKYGKLFSAVAAALFAVTINVWADTTDSAAQAWQEVEQAEKPSPPPTEWQTKRPTREQYSAFQLEQAKAFAHLADLARDFYTRFPNSTNAAEARKVELFSLQSAVLMAYGKLDFLLPHLEKLEASALQDQQLSEDDRFVLRSNIEIRKHFIRTSASLAEALKNQEDVAETLQKEFPKRPEPYQMLLEMAQHADQSDARHLAAEIINNPAPDEIKSTAKILLTKFDRVGKLLQIEFTALDGREVDLSKMTGKVVLVDFWATWCGPCVGELPNVKAAYDKLHAKGFEIVGISFDSDKPKLEHFVADQNMAWPQFFDGQGWQNKFGQQFGIDSIPTQWLVDKKGNLRDLDGRDDLETKVEKLLEE